ncbi:MAG: DUF934 domain-containing protein [Pseudomonadota bacterium]
MAQLIKGRALVANDGTPPLLPLADYLKAMEAGEPESQRGVLLKPEDQDFDPLLPWLSKLPVIAIHFGSSGEGRGYTLGRLLRERHGYLGELRAVGMVRVDQIFFLARCGFDAFDVVDGEDVALAIAQLERFSVAYQSGPLSLTRPRRRYGS